MCYIYKWNITKKMTKLQLHTTWVNLKNNVEQSCQAPKYSIWFHTRSSKQEKIIIFSNAHWDGKTIKKSQELIIMEVRIMVAFGERETVMSGKEDAEDFWGNWQRSMSFFFYSYSQLVLFYFLNLFFLVK